MPRGGKREGAGRPHKVGEILHYITLGIFPSKLKKLDEEAQAKGISRNRLINEKLD